MGYSPKGREELDRTKHVVTICDVTSHRLVTNGSHYLILLAVLGGRAIMVPFDR